MERERDESEWEIDELDEDVSPAVQTRAAAVGNGRPGRGGEPKQKRARSHGVDFGGYSGGSSAPATAPVSASASHICLGSTAAMLVDVSVEDVDALDCVVCYLPLKPPIFQCDVGHVVCSLCRDKLQATGKCHVCRVATNSYRRCHAMERLVESIRVPCSYAAYGCGLRPAYYDQESHRLVCAHAPCHCPGEACSFVGSTAGLLDHFSTAHGWPCITNVKADDRFFFSVRLHDGFNFLVADLYTDNESQGSTANIQRLLLLTVSRQPYARIISVHCIDPHAAATSGDKQLKSKEMQCDLKYSKIQQLNPNNSRSSKNQMSYDHFHLQQSRFKVICTDLSNGLPKPDDCFQFIVPNPAIANPKKDGTKVRVRIAIE